MNIFWLFLTKNTDIDESQTLNLMSSFLAPPNLRPPSRFFPHFMAKSENPEEKLLKPPSFSYENNKIFTQNTIKLEKPERFTGILKHFDEIKNYGFILMDISLSEIFYHFEDVIKTSGVTKEFLTTCRSGNIIKVSFECVEYFGKYQLSRKAVNVKILEDKQQILARVSFLEI